MLKNKLGWMIQSLLIIFLLLFALLTGGCATFQKHYPAAPVNDTDSSIQENGQDSDSLKTKIETVAPGYYFKLSHPDDKIMNGRFQVNFEGHLFLPYNVKIETIGMTVEDLKKRVLQAYQAFFKTYAKVDITLSERAYWVEIGGLITKPGKYIIRSSTSLDEVIGMANGFPTGSGVKFARIKPREELRVQGAQELLIDMNAYYNTGKNSQLKPWRGGEVIFFQREEGASSDDATYATENHIRMMGEVRVPAEVSFRTGADFYYYLSQAGGPTRDADLEVVKLIRKENGKKTMYAFNADELAKIPTLKKGDIILVSSDKQTKAERALGSMSQIATILTSIAVLIIAL